MLFETETDAEILQYIIVNDFEKLKNIILNKYFLKQELESFFIEACKYCKTLDIPVFLISHGAKNLDIGLYTTCKYNNIELAKYLLYYSYDIKYIHLNVDIALIACLFGHLELLEIIITKGDIHPGHMPFYCTRLISDMSERISIQLVKNYNIQKIIDWLLYQGAEISKEDKMKLQSVDIYFIEDAFEQHLKIISD